MEMHVGYMLPMMCCAATMRKGCCNAGFRHEVMPLPFELQMLEVRPARAVSLPGTQVCRQTCLVPPACHLLPRLRCEAEAEEDIACAPHSIDWTQ